MKNLKAFTEKRDSLVAKMEVISNKVVEEVRAFSEEENTEFDALKLEVDGLDQAIAKIGEERAEVIIKEEGDVKVEERAEAIVKEELRAIFEKRAGAMNMTTNAEGGIVVKKELTGEIIKALKDRSNVLAFFDTTSIQGVARLPKKASSGRATWKTETKDPNATSDSSVPTLEVIELGQNRLYRESAITQQMLNSQEIDLKAFIIDDISETMGDEIETAVFNGDGVTKPTGIIAGITKKVDLAVRGTITFEDLKKCKAKLKGEAQKKAKWFMNSDTLLAIDLLKDSTGRFMLQPDVTVSSGYSILGIPVELTDVMPVLADVGDKCLIVLATPKAYHVNIQKSLALYVYDDSSYKRAGLVGFGSDIYLDGKTKNNDVLAGIFNKIA